MAEFLPAYKRTLQFEGVTLENVTKYVRKEDFDRVEKKLDESLEQNANWLKLADRWINRP